MARFGKNWFRQNRLWRSWRVGTLLLRTLFIINRERTRIVQARARGDYDVRPNMGALIRILREFRLTAVDLGGLLIKLGQFLGSRADLLPQAALAELSALTDDVPPEAFADIRRVMSAEWQTDPAQIFAVIDAKPAGSASLGQVHHALLHDGREVAIKVQRPGIDAIIRTDLRTLRFVLRLVSWLVPSANDFINLQALYREFARTVAEELDYEQEARNAEQFAKMFQDDPHILVPTIIHDYSTRRVLVMQWMEGIKIAQTEELDAAGVDRAALAERLVRAYFTQALETGFFHADPHPGNLLVQPDSEADRLVFLDFGMMGLITPKMRTGLNDIVRGFVSFDPRQILRGLDALGFLTETADRDALEPIISLMLSRFGSMNGADMSQGMTEIPREAVGDIEAALYSQPLRLPVEFAYFGRMVGMLQGIAVGLDPEFNFLKTVTPYAQQFLGAGNGQQSGIEGILKLLGVESVGALGQSLLREGVGIAQSLARLPRHLDRVLERAEKGDIHLVLDTADRTDRQQRRSRLGRNGRGRRTQRTPLLSRSVPLWVPLGVLGAFGVATLTRAAQRAAKARK
jgi:predicted unusual protein kinase regulating ubiquinone biosynthesis (AarF/ABC1/UbiB family)